MKKIVLFFLFVISFTGVKAQILNPVSWEFSSEKISDNEANLVITAKMDDKWHIYSLFIEEGGPVATSFTFQKSPDYELIGKTTETPKAVSAFDKNFNITISWHEDKAVFKQKIRLKKSNATVKGSVEFMVCNDKQCLPPEDLEFAIKLKDYDPSKISATILTANKDVKNEDILVGQGADSVSTVYEDSLLKTNNLTSKTDTSKIEIKQPLTNDQASGSLWTIFIAGFLAGLLALMMPCLYPMIPLTISYFTKKSGSRSKAILLASLYGLSIIIIYVSLGISIPLIFGTDSLNDMASNGIFNFIFFVILVIFAISFFGAFDINLPNSWINKIDSQSDKGGLIAIFFMAFALVLVSFSCTGPIISSLIFQATTTGNFKGPAIGMFGFSLALAIPFTLFAAFPALLKSLPKSGGWLNSVKVSLGFLELALALKFLSNVDLAYHWDILDRDIYLIFWIVIFSMMGFYILGKLKFSHDSELPFISIPRILIAIMVFSFTLYMIPGLWGAPLKAISGLVPPQTTQDFDLYTNTLSSPTVEQDTVKKKYAGLFKAPHNLNAFFDYEQGLAYAKKENKPVLIDFTGHSCVNCRKMEASVWSDPEVLKRLKNDYVLISLYVDDKTELPENEKYISKFSGKKIKTLGNKWSDFQAATFNTNSQPYYVLVNPSGQVLVTPQAFNLDINNYIKFLDSGLDAYQNKK
jgi:thiol:disulfide interchange protein DsbD